MKGVKPIGQISRSMSIITVYATKKILKLQQSADKINFLPSILM